MVGFYFWARRRGGAARSTGAEGILAAGMRGQAHERSTQAFMFYLSLQAAFFSSSLPLLPPAAQSFSLHSPTFSGAAGREAV